MTHEAMKIAIATACGWRLHGCNDPQCWINNTDPAKLPITGHFDVVPDYTGSLDAMHEAEATLTKVQAIEYAMALEAIVGAESDEEGHPYPEIFKFIHATALQRATAFVRALNLDEAKPKTSP
jgi:hypothetical protein